MPGLKKCVFCKSHEDNILLGEQYSDNGYFVHYFCLLLSEKSSQTGNDHEGIMGFTTSDIQKEVERCKNIKCVYCKTSGASLKCKKCFRKFHLPCGLKNGISTEFINEFPTFCRKHTKKPKILKLKQEPCMACLLNFANIRKDRIIVSACCKKCIHIECAQNYANNAGYELKCPNCRNCTEFRIGLLKQGVFVPLREPLWENNDNFGYLTEERRECEEEDCLAENRSVDRSNTIWDMLVCIRCGVFGAHRACANIMLTEANNYNCKSCKSAIVEKLRQSENAIATIPCAAPHCQNLQGRYNIDNNLWRPINCSHCQSFMIHFTCNDQKTEWRCINDSAPIPDTASDTSTYYSAYMSDNTATSDKENDGADVDSKGKLLQPNVVLSGLRLSQGA